MRNSLISIDNEVNKNRDTQAHEKVSSWYIILLTPLLVVVVVVVPSPTTWLLFERSEFLIATCKKKKTDSLCVCLYVRLILVLVLGRQIVYGQNTVYLCLSKYIVFENTAVQASCEKHSTEWRLPTYCPQRRSPLVPSRTDSSNLHVI